MHSPKSGMGRGFLVVLVAVASSAARADDAVLVEAIAGLEASGSDHGYGFVTAGIAPPISSGLRLPLRLTASYLRYTFMVGTATTAVEAPGVSLLAGLAFHGEQGGLVLYGGAELRREQRRLEGSPDPATVDLRLGAIGQLEANLALGRRLHAFALATYAGAARYTYAKLTLRGQLNNLDWQGPLTFFLGAEGTGQGNADTRAAQAGGSFEVGFVRAHLSLGVHAGVQETWSPGQPHTRGPYAGLSLYCSF